MGLSSDLRVFIDPDYEDFEGFPTDPASVAEKWGGAFTTAFTETLTPSAAAGLVFAGGSALITQSLTAGLAAGGKLPEEIDKALKSAADKIAQDSAAASAVAPADQFNSEIEVFKGLDPEVQSISARGGDSIAKQIADFAEARFGSWIVTGEFTAFASSPSPIPEIPWGAAPDPPEEEEDE